jgi:hypothetical protein
MFVAPRHLKRAYSQLVEHKMRLGINHIDKLEFLTAYPLPRAIAFKSDMIQKSFAAAGLVPINAVQVLSKRTILLRTPSPPRDRPSSRSGKLEPRKQLNTGHLNQPGYFDQSYA